MCGIAGFLNKGELRYDWRACLDGMSAQLIHRGPDDGGVWFDAARGIGLSHRRLSIIDLSAAGHQPMLSRNDRYVIAFNGEIYNFPDLKRYLEQLGHGFRGHSDTEVMLASFEQWGVEEALKRFVGMFAFALWDRDEETLFLARDRVGEKPLYYGWSNDNFLFGSELKALRRHPAWTGGIDAAALNLFFRYTYIPAPHSIHPGIHKLSPGCYLRLSCRDGRRDQSLHAYWSVSQVARAGLDHPFRGDERDAADAVEATLGAAIARQTVSDVPLGAFLSGGYDSSTVVALMQKQSAKPIKTFTIGFNEAGYDEARHARAVSRHLGTDHSELYFTENEALGAIRLLPFLYDEPFADSSQIPTYLLAKFTREQVTVSLSGDGGDELFCGYDRYDLVEDNWRRISLLPVSLRRRLAALVTGIPTSVLDRFCRLPSAGGAGMHGDRIHRLARLFGSNSPYHLNEQMTAYDLWADAVTNPGPTPPASGLRGEFAGDLSCIPSHMMLVDFSRYLPDDILVKVDRAAMGVSLESRIPFLDQALIELVWSLPVHFKRRNGQRKWLLRQILYNHVPKRLVDRPKMGFGLPVGLWLRGPLRDWAEDLLSEAALRESGLLNPAPVRQKWREHLSGRRTWSYELWPVLMFQAWHRHTSV